MEMKEHEHTETFLCGTKYWFPLNHIDRINHSVELSLLILVSRVFFVCSLLLAGALPQELSNLKPSPCRTFLLKNWLGNIVYFLGYSSEQHWKSNDSDIAFSPPACLYWQRQPSKGRKCTSCGDVFCAKFNAQDFAKCCVKYSCIVVNNMVMVHNL